MQIICRDYGLVCIRREGQDVEKIILDDEILYENRVSNAVTRQWSFVGSFASSNIGKIFFAEQYQNCRWNCTQPNKFHQSKVSRNRMKGKLGNAKFFGINSYNHILIYRNCISRGLSIKYLTADEVIEYIREQHLYLNPWCFVLFCSPPPPPYLLPLCLDQYVNCNPNKSKIIILILLEIHKNKRRINKSKVFLIIDFILHLFQD